MTIKNAESAAYHLLELHLDCLFTCEHGRMLLVNEPWGSSSPAPMLYLGQTVFSDIIHRFHQEAPDGFIQNVKNLLRQCIWDAEQYATLLPQSHIVQETCFCLPQFLGQPTSAATKPSTSCRLLEIGDAPLLEAAFTGCGSELPTAAPYAACFVDSQLASICRSVRKTPYFGGGFRAAHEAGIETLPHFRRKGCASKALAAWTTALLQEKTVPLYSALIENNFSQQLAKKSGWIVYGYGLSIYDKI